MSMKILLCCFCATDFSYLLILLSGNFILFLFIEPDVVYQFEGGNLVDAYSISFLQFIIYCFSSAMARRFPKFLMPCSMIDQLRPSSTSILKRTGYWIQRQNSLISLFWENPTSITESLWTLSISPPGHIQYHSCTFFSFF